MSFLDTSRAVALGLSVTAQTKKPADGATAAGYALWVQSITGTLPMMQSLGAGRARVFLTAEQRRAMNTWIEGQIKKSLTDKTPPTLETDIGAVLGGTGAKWGVLGGALLFVAGAVGLKIFENL